MRISSIFPLACMMFCLTGCVTETGNAMLTSLNSMVEDLKTTVASNSYSRTYHGILTIKKNEGVEKYHFTSFSGHNIYLGDSKNTKLSNGILEVKANSYKVNNTTYQATVHGYFTKKENSLDLLLDTDKEFSLYEDTVFPIGGPEKLGQKKICGNLNIVNANGVSTYKIENAKPAIKGNDEVYISDDIHDDVINIIKSKNMQIGNNICVSGELYYLDTSDYEEDDSLYYFASGKKLFVTSK